MTYSQIEITFNVNFFNNNILRIVSNLGSNTFYWTNLRSAPFQVTVGPSTLLPGERAAMNFTDAFNLDMNNSGQYVVSRTGNVVLIKCNNPLEEFNSIYAASRFPLGGGEWEEFEIILPNEISNFVGTAFEITSTAFSNYSTDPDNYVNIAVATNVLAPNFISPVSYSGNMANPFVFSWMRNQAITIECNNGSGQTAMLSIQTPSFFNISNRQVIVNPSPFGANLTINLNSASDLVIEYSLDNATWQSSSSFSGLLAGTYNVYVRDQYGSVQNFSVLVGGMSNINVPFFFISKSNSLRFANRINFGTSGNYRNDENTLSCEAFAKDERLRVKELQLFNSSDVITTQFKSNYTNHSVVVNKPDGTTDTISVLKKSNNIGLKESLDAKIYAYSSTKSGVYFTSGNTYDFTTGTANGTHSLYGQVPTWGVVGNYIKIDSNFYLIEEVIYDDNKNSDVIIFSNPYVGTPDATLIVGCSYNLFNYDIYEFTIDMVAYLGQNISVQLTCTDTNFQTITLLSETINVEVEQKGTIDLHYWSNENTDIFYATGIRNRLRLVVGNIIADDPNESEIHKTDSNAKLLNSEMYEGIEIEFEPQTKELHRKTKQALLHDNVYIDDVQYVINGSFEVEQLGDTNLYVLKAKLLKTGNVFSNNNATGLQFNIDSQEIPGLISTQSGFVKY